MQLEDGKYDCVWTLLTCRNYDEGLREYIPLPEEKARLKLRIVPTPHELSQRFYKMSSQTDEYSNADIAIVTR